MKSSIGKRHSELVSSVFSLKIGAWLTIAATLFGIPVRGSSSEDVEHTLQYLLKYGRNWKHPSVLVENGLPHSFSKKIAGKVLTF